MASSSPTKVLMVQSLPLISLTISTTMLELKYYQYTTWKTHLCFFDRVTSLIGKCVDKNFLIPVTVNGDLLQNCEKIHARCMQALRAV